MTLQYEDEFGIVKGEVEYSVWPTRHPLPAGYTYTGPVGTRAEMETLLAQQFVETTPAGYFQSRFSDTF